jgi:hypothetical protein
LVTKESNYPNQIFIQEIKLKASKYSQKIAICFLGFLIGKTPLIYTFLELFSHAFVAHIKIQMFVDQIRFSNNTPIGDCTHKLFLREKSFVKVWFIVLKLDGCGTIKS